MNDKIKHLYEKDTKEAYKYLQELEKLSEDENSLYSYFYEFMAMLKSDQWAIRVRGFRLICKQAKWDNENLINKNIKDILMVVNDEKPTAVRMALKYLEYVVPYKNELCSKIKKMALSIDLLKYKDTMAPLIKKDIQSLIQLIDTK